MPVRPSLIVLQGTAACLSRPTQRPRAQRCMQRLCGWWRSGSCCRASTPAAACDYLMRQGMREGGWWSCVYCTTCAQCTVLCVHSVLHWVCTVDCTVQEAPLRVSQCSPVTLLTSVLRHKAKKNVPKAARTGNSGLGRNLYCRPRGGGAAPAGAAPALMTGGADPGGGSAR